MFVPHSKPTTLIKRVAVVALFAAVIGERLIATAAAAGADLLVMGAYGHSRLRELVLGGATLSALKHPALPLLMVH